MESPRKAIPNELSWVRAQHSCSPFEVFKILQIECTRDVEDRNEIRSEAETTRVAFKIRANGDNFLVLREGVQINSSVQFAWTTKGITVRDNDSAIMLEAALVVNDEGECRLLLEKEELTFWQFRKRALHALFFNFMSF